MLFSSADFYSWMNSGNRGAGKLLFSCIEPETVEEAPGRLVFRLQLPPGYPTSREFFQITKGALAAVPTLLGQRPANVILTSLARGAEFEVRYVAVPSLVSRFLRWLARPITIWYAARELKAANEILTERYYELDSARSAISRQATQLRTAHTISVAVHKNLDLDQTIEAVADALVSVAGFVGVEVAVTAVVDDVKVERNSTLGTPSNRVEPIDAPLTSRSRVLGSVRVWPSPDSDYAERRDLLAFILPSVAAALDDALAFTELQRYRTDLEIRVAEKTTELVRRDADLRATIEDLKKAQATRDRIFANINHEIRTPLALIMLLARDIVRHMGDSADAVTQDSLQRIEISSRKLVRLVDTLLLLSSKTEGKMSVELRRFDVANIVNTLVGTWRAAAGVQAIVLRYAGPPSLVMDTDDVALERILTNLLSNAIKYTPNGGSVLVELQGGDEMVTLTVRDTGVGIDEDLKKRLFGRFERGKAALRRGVQGSGIGLSLVKELTEEMGGRVDVESPLGGGTAFHVRLPFADSGRAVGAEIRPVNLQARPEDFGLPTTDRATPGTHVHVSPPRAVPTVLVAEDEPNLAAELIRILEVDYRVVCAPDGMTALALAGQHHPDILVSDVSMPGMDGYELTERFRALVGNRLAPVILLSAYTSSTDRLRGFQAGALDYVAKPFDPEELIARVRSQLALRDFALKLYESEKLASLGRLSAGLAHEIRNPANAIVNAVAPLQELLPPELVELGTPTGDLLSVLGECAAQIGAVSRQLLGFSRPGHVDWYDANLGELVGRASRLLGPSLDGVQVKSDFPENSTLSCSPSLLAQVFIILLENGAQAVKRGGWIRITFRMEPNNAVIEVSDSGTGVPVDLRERVFEPFFTTKPVGEGTGLGLSTARQLVGHHGGTLEIVGANGGSVFRISIPQRAHRRELARPFG
ncbi:MAG: ATP-binding protein [Polyangiaceae bacterium]